MYHEEQGYWQDVFDIAAEILRAAQEHGEGQATHAQAAQGMAEGSLWTRSTSRARCVLYWSHHENAVFDAEEDWLSPCQSMSEIYQRASVQAMREDILEALDQIQKAEN